MMASTVIKFSAILLMVGACAADVGTYARDSSLGALDSSGRFLPPFLPLHYANIGIL